LFLGGIFVLALSPLFVGAFAAWQGASTEPSYGALMLVSLSALFWVVAVIFTRFDFPVTAKDAAIVWIFLPAAPFLYAAILFANTHDAHDHALALVFLPACGLIMVSLARALFGKARRTAQRFFQQAYDGMSAHERLALMHKTKTHAGDDGA